MIIDTYLRSTESLQQPIYVEATGESSPIVVCTENLWGEVTIRIPQRPSAYILGILESAAVQDRPLPVSTGAHSNINKAATSSIAYTTIYTGANMPVIAHGTWFRKPVNQSPRPAPRWYHLHVSGFHPTTAIYQIRKILGRTAQDCNMRQRPIGYNAITVLIQDESDALLLRDALNGRNCQGAQLRAICEEFPSVYE